MVTGFPQCDMFGLAWVVLQVAMVMPSVEEFERRRFAGRLVFVTVEGV